MSKAIYDNKTQLHVNASNVIHVNASNRNETILQYTTRKLSSTYCVSGIISTRCITMCVVKECVHKREGEKERENWIVKSMAISDLWQNM